jgi:hypothetical protein
MLHVHVLALDIVSVSTDRTRHDRRRFEYVQQLRITNAEKSPRSIFRRSIYGKRQREGAIIHAIINKGVNLGRPFNQ